MGYSRACATPSINNQHGELWRIEDYVPVPVLLRILLHDDTMSARKITAVIDWILTVIANIVVFIFLSIVKQSLLYSNHNPSRSARGKNSAARDHKTD
jgi:hypothetical protein